MFDTIILCADGSEHSLRAAKVAADLARKYGATVVGLNVNQASLPMLEPSAQVAGISGAVYRQQFESAQERICDGLKRLFSELDVPFRFRAEVGQPVSVIVSIAEQERANLIVIGSRGMGSFKSFLIGSVSDGVVHHAHCPVMVVR
ncbi:MAG: universal stress protein [Capsulimonadaceae bacterium]|nr:universal stress protein [Capsulimonadaceae bacterium]